MFDTDAEIFQFVRQNLYVAVVCDMLDTLGYRNQACTTGSVRCCPIYATAALSDAPALRAGWRRTMSSKRIPMGGNWTGRLPRARDVVIHSTDYGSTNAPWGELMSTIAKYRGAVGTVCDSQVRDCVRIIEMGFPVYYAGIRPLNSKGRGLVVDYDVPVMCGEVLVHPGELVFADFDGVVVIPKAVETEVLRLAHATASQETISRQELLAGKSLKEVYAKYGVL
jgi:4-hydroxy-4-methyl-2-oxoglutarate aldolase